MFRGVGFENIGIYEDVFGVKLYYYCCVGGCGDIFGGE